MTSPPDHVASKFSPKPFNSTYSGPSDDQSPLAKVAPRHSNTSLESSTSSSNGRGNAPNYHFIRQGKHSVPQKVRSGENLDVATTAGLIDAAASDTAPCDGSESSSAYPNSSCSQTEVSVGESTPTSEFDLSREDNDQTPRNPEPVESTGDADEDAGCDDEHREMHQLTPARITPADPCTVTVKRREIFEYLWKRGQPTSQKIKVSIPVRCQRQNNPCVCLRIVPCQNEHSRHVIIEGELLVPRACSRYKWLVQYCECSIVVSVIVVDPAESNKRISSVEKEFEIQHDELNIDHRTTIKLEEILKHKQILYNNNRGFTFRVTVQLLEHQVINEDVPFECTESDNSSFTFVVSKA